MDENVRKMHETCLECDRDSLRGKIAGVCSTCIYNALRTKVENESQNRKAEESSED